MPDHPYQLGTRWRFMSNVYSPDVPRESIGIVTQSPTTMTGPILMEFPDSPVPRLWSGGWPVFNDELRPVESVLQPGDRVRVAQVNGELCIKWRGREGTIGADGDHPHVRTCIGGRVWFRPDEWPYEAGSWGVYPVQFQAWMLEKIEEDAT